MTLIRRRKVLVIGASGDIGQAIACKLAESNYDLCLHYFRNRNSLERLVADHKHNLGTFELFHADLEDLKSLATFKNALAIDDIVFANGLSNYDLLTDISVSNIEKLNRHFLAQTYIVKMFLPNLIKQRRGNIIFISSIWGEIGASSEVMYSAFMGARNLFVKALSKEAGPSQIRVNAVAPGAIKTKMLAALSELVQTEIVNNIPLGRLGTPDDVAHAVLFLLSDAAKYITGQIINVNGGWYLN